jgi:hypothetical protein
MKTIFLPTVLLGFVIAGCAQTASQRSAEAALPSATTSAVAPVGTSTVAPATQPPVVAEAATHPADPTAAVSVSVPTAPTSVSAVVPPPVDSAAAGATTHDGTPTATSDVSAANTTASNSLPAAASATIEERMVEWKLTGDVILEDIKKSARIERTKTSWAGAPTGPMESGIIADIVGAKFRADDEIAPLKFGLMVVNDVVTITGFAASPDQIGRAMALALDTDGVFEVISRIKLEPATP